MARSGLVQWEQFFPNIQVKITIREVVIDDVTQSLIFSLRPD